MTIFLLKNMATESIHVDAGGSTPCPIRHVSIKLLLERSAAVPQAQGPDQLSPVKHFKLSALSQTHGNFSERRS